MSTANKEKPNLERILPALPFVFLAATFLSRSEWFNPLIFPKPEDLLQLAPELLSSEKYWSDLGKTMLKTLTAIGYGAAIGVPIGALMGELKKTRLTLENFFDFLRGIPVTALAGYFYLLSYNYGPSVLAPVYFNMLNLAHQTSSSIVNIDQNVREAALIDGANPWQMLRYISLPLALDQVFLRLKSSLQYTLLVVIAMEMYGVYGGGVGGALRDAQWGYRQSDALIYLISIGLVSQALGMTADKLSGWYRRGLYEGD
ncbi:MAG TPA: ABC transporter permease subunit [Candidatus Woesebacteria bacterium]|nr:ABC transporter permease subunit [Candidatus Woesebacteria bacterium]